MMYDDAYDVKIVPGRLDYNCSAYIRRTTIFFVDSCSTNNTRYAY